MAYLSICLVLFLSHPQLAPQAGAGPDFEALVRESRFIFAGRVEKLNASNLKVLPPTKGTVLVRVREVLDAPPTLMDVGGKQITVELVEPGSVNEGQEAVFFTNGWLYGDSIAVKEVSHLAITENTQTLQKQVAAARRKAEDQILQKRIASAELVILGKVSSARQAPESVGRGGSEHDPDWWEAIIQVESVEQGHLVEKSVTVLFPKSRDVMWARAPKFRENQDGIWLLRKEKIPALGRKFEEYYTALDPLDFQPREQLERIRMLIKGVQEAR